MEKTVFEHFEKGRLTVNAQTQDCSSIPWTEHGEFQGVFLKTLLSGDHTNGLLTCHLVRIDPGKRIGLHAHPASIEIHEILAGSGTCLTQGVDIGYTPGSMAVIACNVPHEVVAGQNGLCFFARFIPVSA